MVFSSSASKAPRPVERKAAILKLSFAVLLAAAATCWFISGVTRLLPVGATNWGLIVEQTSSESGEARLFYEDGSGVSNARSVSRPVEAGRRQRLYFPLPQGIGIEGFRLDPIDRPEGNPEITLHRFEVVGPMGFWFLEKPGAKDARARHDLEVVEERDGQLFRAKVTGPDPQIRISVSTKPLPPPRLEFVRSSQLVATALFLALAMLFVAIRWVPRLRLSLLWLAGLGWLLYLISHWVAPVRSLDPMWFYQALFGPSLFLALLSLREAWPSLRMMFRSPPLWALAALALYFGLLTSGMAPDSEPARGTVLANLAILLLAPAVFLVVLGRFRFESPWTKAVWIGVATVVAAAHVVWMYDSGIPFTTRLAQATSLGEGNFTPLHKTTSGSACFAMALLLGVSWADSAERRLGARRRAPRWAGYAAAALPIMLYLLFAQARSVCLGTLAGMLVLALAPKAWTARFLCCAFLFLGFLFTFGDLPRTLDKITGRSHPEPAAAQGQTSANEAEEPVEESTAGEGILGRTVAGRFEIWKTYLGEIKNKPIFGHGFGAPHKLPVELDESLFAPQDAHLAHQSWSSHSVHLSTLYFGGGVGLLINLSLLGSIFVLGIRRSRETGQTGFLLSSAWIALAAIDVVFESNLMADNKESVLLRYPNELWIFYWGAVVFGIVQTSLPSLKASAPADLPRFRASEARPD